MSNSIELLDCTIRDGGYVNDWQFSDDMVRNCYIACSNSGIDYMEIGFRNIKKPQFLEKYGPTFFCDDEFINKTVGDINGCKIAVMVTINEFDINVFLPKSQSKIDMVRVLLAYHGSKNKSDDILDIDLLKQGMSQVRQLVDLGYEISFNVGRIDKMSKSQIYELCKIISQEQIKYFTMADTYGCVDLNDIETLIPYVTFLLRDVFETNIKIGFHAHDNMSTATAKSLHSLKFGVTMIDGCILGYGRGSGNAKTELLMMDLNKNYNKSYDFVNSIDFGDSFIVSYKECQNNLCYNVIYALSSYYGCHVSYAIDIIEKFEKMNISDICYVFSTLKQKKQNMFYNDRLFMIIYTEKII
uniref:Pyruvate carboxyltransferase domain-containing protein n=1 Tax=viral metagenome TaxID=1070528 RepID=A0A6C0ATB2_9ZZZZ